MQVLHDRHDELSVQPQKSDGVIMREYRVLLHCLAFQRQAYHSGAVNGNDVDRVFTKDAVRVRHKLSTLKCPECSHSACSEYATEEAYFCMQ